MQLSAHIEMPDISLIERGKKIPVIMQLGVISMGIDVSLTAH